MFGKLPRFRVLQLCGLPFHASHNGRSRTGADLWAFASEPDKLPDRVNFANLVADYLVNICILVICTRMLDKTPGATYILIEGNDLFLIKNIAKVTTDSRVAFVTCHNLVKIQLQNLDQASAPKSWLNVLLRILTNATWLCVMVNFWEGNVFLSDKLSNESPSFGQNITFRSTIRR